MFDEARQLGCSLGEVVDKQDRLGRSPLFLAVKERQHNASRVLLGIGPDIDAGSSQSGWSPLLMASFVGDKAHVEALVAHGASVDHRCSTGCNFTPLAAAAASKHSQICSALRAAGADVEYALDLMRASTYTSRVEVAEFIVGASAMYADPGVNPGLLVAPSAIVDLIEVAKSLKGKIRKLWTTVTTVAFVLTGGWPGLMGTPHGMGCRGFHVLELSS
jgi:ankyrin repeat protein